MNISFFIGGLSGGGAERVVSQLASYLSRKGHDVTIMTVSKSDVAYEIDRNVRIMSLSEYNTPRFKSMKIYYKYKRLKEYIRESNSDVYIAFLPYCIAALSLLRKSIKSPIIGSSRNDPSLYPYFKRLLLMWATKRLDGVVNQTDEINTYFLEHTRMKSYRVIPNAISEEFMPYLGKREKRIVTVGRLNEQKNIPLLINAFEDVHKEHPEYVLEIYGDGPYKCKLMDLVNEKGLTESVHFKGYIRKVSEYIDNASMFVITSDYEGISNALMEAMAIGLPVISTDSRGGGARMLIQNNLNGILVPCGDIKQVKNAMDFYIKNPQTAELYGRNATEITKELSPNKIHQTWEDYIISIVNK